MARLTKQWSQAECDYLNRYIKADFETGFLYWKEDSPNGRYKAGERLNTSLAGVSDAQYLIFAVYHIPGSPRQRNFKVHHVIWFLKTGEQSKVWIDHIDRNKLNNAFSNLREATKSQNLQNTAPRKGRKLKGVCERKNGLTWATIRCSHKSVYLGNHPTPEQAARAYDLASIVLHGDYGYRNFPDADYSATDIENMRQFINNKLSLPACDSVAGKEISQEVAA